MPYNLDIFQSSSVSKSLWVQQGHTTTISQTNGFTGNWVDLTHLSLDKMVAIW